ncbi:hypothetical protein KCG44_09135 [Pacificimonas sp. WHA3]|uniref:Uncharacterized protein n=1 Tax=Pacificimonas pallii TaxID=2827236 RepID=A0ABS6SEW4_9SPHN|nr:DUF6683 family protein [Pacificimonas pallii]MBV7256944.1 hypothetical protein [Pacificimonas pallii]
MKTNVLAAVSAAALAICSGPAAAQDFGFMNNAISSDILHDSVFRDLPKRKVGRNGSLGVKGSAASGSPRAGLTAPPQVGAASLSFGYTPSDAVSRQVEHEMYARLQKNNPASAAAMKSLFERHDPVDGYQQIARNFGVPTRDLAATMAAYNVLGWLIANGEQQPPRGALSAARSQVAQIIAQDARYRSEDFRRKLDEEFMRLFFSIYAGWEHGRLREGPTERRAFSDGVNEMWKSMFGKDLRAMELTSQGFRDRG